MVQQYAAREKLIQRGFSKQPPFNPEEMSWHSEIYVGGMVVSNTVSNMVRGMQPAVRLAGTGNPTVWSEFGELSVSLGPGAVNLGQGFPDWQPPAFVVQQAFEALSEGQNQYTRPAGHPALVEVLAQRYSRHFGRSLDALSEVTVTVGASQALYLTLQALVNPGDEVLLLEPAFDLYYGQVKLTGASVVPVALAFDDGIGEWRLDAAALDAAVTPRTKLLIFNSPHNPTGKVFSRGEMEAIAAVVARHPHLLVISDEVYKYIVHSGGEHIHFASLPGMFERTVTLSSAGKTFSITGWQNGWCIGPEQLIMPIQRLLPYVQFCAPTPMQQARSPRAVATRTYPLLTPLDVPIHTGALACAATRR